MLKISDYTKLVRYIKYGCITAAVVTILFTCYFVLINRDNKIRQDTSIKATKKEIFNSKIIKPDVVGINMENGLFYVKATEMQEIANLYKFKSPIADIMLDHKDWLNITSDKAELVKDQNILELFDNVEGNFNKLYYFSGIQTKIQKDKNIISSDKFSKFYDERNSIESDTGFILNYHDETIFFFGKINTNLKQDDGITNIKSEKFDVFWKKREGHYIDNVILTKTKTTVSANKMIAYLNPKTDELEKVLAFGNVKISDKENTAIGDFGEYKVSTEILTLKDNVELLRGGNTAKGELLHYNFKTQKADLISSPTKNDGRVKAVIIPQKK